MAGTFSPSSHDGCGILRVRSGRWLKAAAAVVVLTILFVVLLVVTAQRPHNPKHTLWPIFLFLVFAWGAGLVYLLAFQHRRIEFGSSIAVCMVVRTIEVPWADVRMIAWREVRQPTILQPGPGFRTVPTALIVLQLVTRKDEWYLEADPRTRPAVIALLDEFSQAVGANVCLRPNPNDARLHEWSVTRPA